MKKVVPVSIIVLAFLYNFMFGNRYINLISEGYIYYGALKILNGSILYRDYFAPYTPAPFFYLTAFFFKIFGPGIEVGRFITYFAAAAAVVVFLSSEAHNVGAICNFGENTLRYSGRVLASRFWASPCWT